MQNVDLSEIDWSDLYPRLLLFAAGKLNRLTWRGRRFGSIPGALTPQDCVQDAIKKTLSGERAWNNGASLFRHLEGVISSQINHLVNSSENRSVLLDALDDGKVVQIQDRRNSPEVALIRKAQEEEFFSYLESTKPILRQIAYLILYEPTIQGTPELMVSLNLSLREVESLKRALRRATENFLREKEKEKSASQYQALRKTERVR